MRGDPPCLLIGVERQMRRLKRIRRRLDVVNLDDALCQVRDGSFSLRTRKVCVSIGAAAASDYRYSGDHRCTT